jgi:hypothetical protein
VKNPYRPGVGLAPAYLAGRDHQLKRFAATLRAAPEIPANIRMTGLRGVGKTVLLHEFEKTVDRAEWASIFVELQAGHNSDLATADLFKAELLRLRERMSVSARLKERAKNAVDTAKMIATFNWNGFTVGGGEASLFEDSATLGQSIYDTVLTALNSGYLGIVLLLDEAQMIRDDKEDHGEHPLSLLLSTVAELQKQELPVAMVLCGLPNLAVNLLSARTYSERMFKGEEVSSLPQDAARAAFTQPLVNSPITADDELVERVLASVDGYPYFIQLWGAELWDMAEYVEVPRFTPELLDSVEPEIYRRLDLDFYDPRISSLTPAEQDLLIDSAKCPYPPLHVADLNKSSPKKAGNVNVLLGRLVQANVLYRERKSQYMYTAPGFKDYLERRSAK